MSNATMEQPVQAATATTDDEAIRQSIEQEAEESEQEVPEPEQEAESEESQEDSVSTRLLGAVSEVTEEIKECDNVIQRASEDYDAVVKKADEEHRAALAKAADERDSLTDKMKTRRQELEQQLRDAVQKVQSQFRSFLPAPKQPQKRRTNNTQQRATGVGSRPRHDKSIKTLIMEFLGEHRQARTSEIREYLQGIGRATNPGVELSRLVKNGDIVNKERGLYTLPARR